MEYSGSESSTDIAVIGLSLRFPGAPNYNIFWNNLINNKETITFFNRNENNYVDAKPFVENSDKFDADFFKVSSREAAMIDPQHRIFLQSAWHAFEDAGYMPQEIKGQVGVFAASNFNTYQHVEGWFSKYWRMNHNKPSARFLAYTGNIQDTLATRVSYKLNLKGPSITIQTACSSSLVAMHLGCQSLRQGESSMVLVGASALTFPDKEGYYFEEGMILSSDGHCRAFDQAANGTVFGNGVACVVLKLLNQSIKDGDHIYGVIKGSAINNDGARKVDFYAPSVLGQKEVIQKAHELARAHPETIGYVEAHGTGTIVGDPIEFEALSAAFNVKTKKKQFCGIGSVKSNIGHLDAASGMAGFIKALLALDKQIIPATIHFQRPNEHFDLDSSPFYVVDENQEFKTDEFPRRCAVTSLGIGGTNAHFVLEEAPKKMKNREGLYQGPFPFFLSAGSEEQLRVYIGQLLVHIQNNRESLRLSDIAFTLATSRLQKQVKCVGFFNSLEELEQALDLDNPDSSLAIFSNHDSGIQEIIKKAPKECSEQCMDCVDDWIKGININEHSFFDSFERFRSPLPGYPFKECRYWYDQIKELKIANSSEDFLNKQSSKDEKEIGYNSRDSEMVSQKNNRNRPLAEVWEEVLGKGTSNKEENFYTLGGNSLQLMQLVALCNKYYKVNVALPEFLLLPTFRKLEEIINTALVSISRK